MNDWQAVAPTADQKGYDRILAKGCQGSTYHGPDGSEHDCVYVWSCEDCPILQERWAKEAEQEELEHCERHGLIPLEPELVAFLPDGNRYEPGSVEGPPRPTRKIIRLIEI